MTRLVCTGHFSGCGRTSKVETLSRYVKTRTRCRREVRDGGAELAVLHPEVSRESVGGCITFGRVTQKHL
jgi:hypothetical protein